MGRLDHSIGQNDKITARYEFDRFTKGPVFNPQLLVAYTDATFSIIAQNALLHETHIFSPRVINDARFSYSREVSTRGPAPNAANVTDFGVAIPFQPTPSGIQQIGVQGGFTLGDNPKGLFTRNNYTWSNDVAWGKGKHDVHIGGMIERSQVNLNNEFNQPGIFGFGTQDNYLFGGTGFATYQLFLAGILSDGSSAGNGYALQQGAGEFKNNRNTFSGIYVQDNYRVTRRLTLNLGVRYEPALAWRDTGDRWAQVNLAAMAANTVSRVYPNAPPGIFFSSQNGIASDPGMPKNALNDNWKGIAPRLGFALDVFGDGKTSLRGGAGIFYDSRVMGMLSNRFVDEWPFSPQFILSTAGNSAPTAASTAGSFSDPLCTQAATQAALNCTGAQGGSYPTFPSPFPAPTSFPYSPPFNQIAVSYDPSGEYKVPAVYEWNLTFERELPFAMLMRMAYVGSRSTHILETQDFNAAPCCTTTGKAGIGTANSLVKAASGGKFGTNTFSTVQADITDINANYHSLQTSLEKRMSHGLTLLANYTWSRSLDDLPFGEGVSGFDTGYSPLPLSDPNRHRFDYGPSSFDHTHVFTASYVWQTPGLKGSRSFIRHLLGDYELSGIVSAASGRPITVLQGTEISGTGIGQDRGTFIPGADPYTQSSCAGATATCVSWLTPSAFQPTKVAGVNNPAIFGTFGDVGKNALRLPRTSDWDIQLSKYFSITERWKLQLRGEYFNVLNHPNFAPESISTGTINGTDQISAFDKLNGNSSFGTFRAGQAGDPRIVQLAVKVIF
jgi:TonB-dependent receptor-like protein